MVYFQEDQLLLGYVYCIWQGPKVTWHVNKGTILCSKDFINAGKELIYPRKPDILY